MARLDYETDKDADERLNPASELSARESTAFTDGLRDNTETNPEQNNTADSIVRDKEKDLRLNYRPTPDKNQVRFNFKNARPALFGGGGIIGIILFLFFGIGPGMLPFSFMGNLNQNSVTHSLQAFIDDHTNFRLFGSKADGPASKAFSGLKQSEIDRLKADGVKFSPEGGNKVGSTNRLAFDSIEIDGKVITRDNFNEMMKNAKLRSKVYKVGNRSLFKGVRNSFARAMRATKKISLAPDLDSKTNEEFRKKVYSSVSGSEGSISTASATPTDADNNSRAGSTDASKANSMAGVSDEMKKAVDSEVALAKEGKPSGLDIGSGDLGSTLEKYQDFDLEASRSPAAKIWGLVNSLDMADMLCTTYQIGSTAATLASTLVAIQTIRYGMSFLSTINEVQATGDYNEGFNRAMETITKQDSLGRSFDSSSAVQYIFTGQLSNAQPLSVSAVGGEALLTLISTMSAINGTVGLGTPGTGKTILKGVCGAATNLWVQVGATTADWAVTIVGSIFGGAGAGYKVAKEALVQGAKVAGKTFIKEAIQNSLKEITQTISTRESRQLVARQAARAIKKEAANPFNWAMIGLFLAQSYGMEYIIKALAGTEVLDYTNSGVQTAEAMISAYEGDQMMAGISAGASIISTDMVAEAESVRSYYANLDASVERLNANPFDTTNSYSFVGSLASSLLTINPSLSSPNGFSRAMGVLSVPFRLSASLLSGKQTSASTGNVSQSDIHAFVGDQNATNKNIALRINGSPYVYYKKQGSIDAVLDQAIADNLISVSGETVSVVGGSALEEHMKKCNNPDKYLIDNGLLDEEYIYPEECILKNNDNSQLNYYNNIVTYMSLINPEESQASNTATTNTAPTAPGDFPAAVGATVLPIAPENVSKINWSAGYGAYPSSGRPHWGIDLGSGSVDDKIPFVSSCDGTVDSVRINSSYANRNAQGASGSTNYVWIKCDNGIYIGYAHFYARSLYSHIKPGVRITAGTPIAPIGNQGNSSGPHLHFQINPKSPGGYSASATINPVTYLCQNGVTWPSNWRTPARHQGGKAC